MRVHDWTGELADFADTAALIEALDLVISVDMAVADLPGALGKPVWLLNRFDTDWRTRDPETRGRRVVDNDQRLGGEQRPGIASRVGVVLTCA